MTNERRLGELLPEHLVAQVGNPEESLHGQAHRPRDRGDRVPDRHEPERRPVAVLDQGQARTGASTSSPAPPTSATVRRRSSPRSSPRRLACPTTGSPTTTRTPTLRPCAPGRSPRARRSSPARRREGGAQVRAKLLEVAAKEMEIDAADLEIEDGEVIAKGAPQKRISVATSRARPRSATAS